MWHSLIFVSDASDGSKCALYMIPRYVTTYATKIVGTDNLVLIHRDSMGGSPYIKNLTGQQTQFYVEEILGYSF